MKAIEFHSKTDKAGYLKVDYKMNLPNKKVRVIILVDNEYPMLDDDKIWTQAMAQNPSFDFLKEPEENIYSLNDGEPFDD